MSAPVTLQAIRALSAGAETPRTFTAKEVAAHATPGDLWVIYKGSVFDVTSFAPRHPGGNMIWVKAGGDCTQLFDSYHPLRTKAVLDKYYIGDLERVAGDESEIIEYKDDMKKGQFYMDCKVAVERWFKENKKDPRVHPRCTSRRSSSSPASRCATTAPSSSPRLSPSPLSAALHGCSRPRSACPSSTTPTTGVRQIENVPARDAAHAGRRRREPRSCGASSSWATTRTRTSRASTRTSGARPRRTSAASTSISRTRRTTRSNTCTSRSRTACSRSSPASRTTSTRSSAAGSGG